MSDGGKKEEHSLRELLAKIKHPLLDVRTRALQSIVFKLNNHLLSPSELVHEKAFLAGLLEWFNFEEWVLESQVLGLVEQLAEHDAAALTFVEIGAVEFLSQLRLHCDPSLHPLIDEILELLFKLPQGAISQMNSPASHTPSVEQQYTHYHEAQEPSDVRTAGIELTQDTFTTESTTDFGSYLEISKQSFGVGEPRSLPYLPQCYLQKTVSLSNTQSEPSSESTWSLEGQKDAVHGSRKEGSLPYATSLPLGTGDGNAEKSAVRDGVFPWLRLSVNDCHILATTQSRLQSSNVDTLTRSCDFLQAVLLQDFPAELFLQRPGVVKNLLQLLEKIDSGGGQLQCCVLKCLLELTYRLTTRLRLCTDPEIGCTDSIIIPTDLEEAVGTRALLASELLGQTEAAQPQELEQLTEEMLLQLQSQQLPLQQYCHGVIECVVPLLVQYLNNNDFPLLRQNEGHSAAGYVTVCLQLISTTIGLLLKSGIADWNVGVECLSSVLSQCLSKWRRLSAQAIPTQQLQLICSVTVHLAYCLGYLMEINTSLPPTATTSVLHDLMMNGVITVVCPDLQDLLLPHFEKANPAKSELFKKVMEFATAFQKMSDFLKCWKERPQQPPNDLIPLAIEALPSVYFYCNEEFVTAAVWLSLEKLTESKSCDGDMAKLLLLKLLSHGSCDAQALAYSTFKAIITDKLKGHDSEHTILPVILNSEILRELCCSGVLSDVDGVAAASCEILGFLLSMREEVFWPELRDSLLQWLPYIEVCQSDSVHKQLHDLLESSEAIPSVVRVQSCIRLLFSTNTDLRVSAFTLLSKLLLSEDPGKLSPFSTEASVALHDVLVIVRPLHSNEDRHGTFQHDDVVKLLHILRSPVMDATLKKTALEQLAVLLQDCSLHEPAIEEGIATDITTAFKAALQTVETPEDAAHILKPCVCCLQLLVHSTESLRKDLSNNAGFLLDTFRAVLLCHGDAELLYNASKLFAHLLFCQSEDDKRLPLPLAKRLKFPFQVDSYDPESSPFLLDPEVMLSDPLLSMLRLCYHSAMMRGIENLVRMNEKDLQSTNEKLSVPHGDFIAVKALYLDSVVHDCFSNLRAASTHKEVENCLHHLEMLLVASSGRERALSAELDWKKVLERFLTVFPTTLEDTRLLGSVLDFLCTLVGGPCSMKVVGPSQLTWLVEITIGSSAVCLQLLQSCLHSAEPKHSQKNVQKTILKFYVCLMSRATSIPFPGDYDPLMLIQTLCQCLDVAGCPEYYDLPLLETSLECLQHITASSLMRRTSSTMWLSLCMKLMTSLQQVLWSFISGRGSLMTSFMGKGVTSRAALSLCHLLQTVRTLNPPERWWLQWLQSSDVGPTWLHFLVEDREPWVRYAGLCLLSSLCAIPPTIDLLLRDWADKGPFGLWGDCLHIALDATECSLVRQQAFLVLVSLSWVCSKQKKWDKYLTYTTAEITLKGLEALEVMMESYRVIPSLQELINPLRSSLLKENISGVLTKSPSAMLSLQYSSLQLRDVKCDAAALMATVKEMLSCCNPRTVSGACQLLFNLLVAFPQSTVVHALGHGLMAGLISILDVELLQIFLLASTSGAISFFSRSSWLKMCVDIAVLLRAVVQSQCDTTLPYLLKEEEMGQLCKVLTCIRMLHDCREDYDCLSLCSAIMALLQSIVDRLPRSKAEIVFSPIQMQWDSFTGLVHYGLLNPQTVPSLQPHSLRLLSSLLVHRFQPLPKPDLAVSDTLCATLQYLLDGEDNAEDPITAGSGEKGAGSLLCDSLLNVYDGAMGTRNGQLITETLYILLACSTSAKQTALGCGLLESSFEQMKSLHTKLCMESLDEVASPRKTKDSILIDELIAVMNLLKNFMYKSPDVKSAALECHLSPVIHKLWPWCTVSRRLLLAVIQLLSVFTAQYAKAQASIASNIKGGNTLLHSILKLTLHTITSYNSCSASKTANPHMGALKALFTLLTTCALSTECRGIMKKVTFLSEFISVNPKTEKTSNRRLRLSSLWLKFLVNLSFSTEGQQMIIKLPGSLDVLLDVYHNSDAETQEHSVLVLRNLCFFGPSKTMLASNEQFLDVLSISISTGNKRLVVLAASAVWALLYNCSKIRTIMKKSGIPEKLMLLDISTVHTDMNGQGTYQTQHRDTISKAIALLS